MVNRRAEQRGQALAEAALVLPVLLLFTLAVLQAGWLGYAAVVARHAAYRGARAASVAGARDRVGAGRTAALASVAASPGVFPAGVSVAMRRRAGDLPGDAVEARVSVAVPRLLPGPWSPVARGTSRMPVEPDWKKAAPVR